MNTHKFSPLASKMLCIPQVTALDSAVEKAQVKTFRRSIEKALLLLEGNKWLNDTEGKNYLKDCNLTQEEACKQAYGLNKQTYSLYIRNAKAIGRITNLVDNFLAKCEAKLGAASYSQQSFEAYWKALDKAVENPLPSTEGSEGGEGEDTTEGGVDKVDVSTKPILTLAFNGEAVGQKNVSLRVTDKNEIKTSSSIEDIEKAVAYLQKALKQMKANKPKAEAPKAEAPKAEPKVSKFKIKPTVSIDPAVAAFEAEIASGAPIDADELMDAPF